MRAAIAAGHPATAAAGAEILEAGGTAADAAVAASLASCVAETVMTGMLGGGHAIYFDASERSVRNLDCFCAVPGLGRAADPVELTELPIPFGDETVHYAVGPASCAVPGLPAGLDELWRRHGSLPWVDICAPALQLAREGVPMPPAHAACLAMLAPVMTMNEGAGIYAPGGAVLEAGARLEQPGLVRALELVADEGSTCVYRGSVAEALLTLMHERGGLVTRDDLEAYEAVWLEPTQGSIANWIGYRLVTRPGLSRLPKAFARLGGLSVRTPTERVLAIVDALAPYGHLERGSDTTNVSVVDAKGNACVLTTSLGLGSGDFLPGLDLHLNSMLGEVELLVGDLKPGERMESMMAPTLAFAYEDERLVLAIGAAGGSRLRTALVTVASLVLDLGLDPQEAVAAPRVHPTGTTIHAEPGVDEQALDLLEERGWHVRRWAERHHYFGGVSLVARNGAAGDPRRDGAADVLG
jgi:gamma-glutamyltranspeptidase/glutathione hydrolase